jgi:hypothetical protein
VAETIEPFLLALYHWEADVRQVSGRSRKIILVAFQFFAVFTQPGSKADMPSY